jgi:hypothetical protein
MVGEIGLPIAQRQVVFLIEVAGIVRALDDQKAEHAGITAAVQVVHRHGVGVVPARAGRRGRELIAAASVRRHHRRAFFLRSVHIGGNEQSVKMHNSGTSVSLTTFTVTGTPSFMRSSGPGEVPLYPMVLRMRLGASSTVTGAICSVKSVLATSCGAGRRQKGIASAGPPAGCLRPPNRQS